MVAQNIFEGIGTLLEYKDGLIALVLILWFLERRETTKRFERLFNVGATADLDVATALQAIQTILQSTRHLT